MKKYQLILLAIILGSCSNKIQDNNQNEYDNYNNDTNIKIL